MGLILKILANPRLLSLSPWVLLSGVLLCHIVLSGLIEKMQLNGRQRQQFQQALLSAFPSKAKLAQMLSFELDWELDAIAGGQNQSEIIFNLIKHAQAKGSLDQLLAAAQSDNPGNPALRDFAQQLGNPTNPPSPPETTASGSSFNQTNSGGINFQNNITGGQVIQGQSITINNGSIQNDSSNKDSGNKDAGNSAQPAASTTQPNTTSTSSNGPITVFVSYAHEDETLRKKLDVHLSSLARQGIINLWNDRAINAGSEWEAEINQNLQTAQIILLLISADFIASDFCYCKELDKAMARHKAGTACVIPIILRSTDLEGTSFSKLQSLPTDRKPITTWDNQDAAFLNVVQGIRRAIANFPTSS